MYARLARHSRDRFKRHLQTIRNYKGECNTLHEHFSRGTCTGVHNIRGLSTEDTEIELEKIEMLWMDRLMSEYPQGLNHTRHDSRSRHMYYK